MNSFAAFTDDDCLKSSSETVVSHKGFPFGLTENTLNVKKEGCVITLDHESMKYLKKRWIIDVCRGPIHIKEGTGAISVHKRIGNCRGSVDTEYCSGLSELELLLQDDGLIFASGDKDNLEDDHGKLYCSYMLTLAYLDRGIVFSTNKQYSNVLKRGIYKATAVHQGGRPLLELPNSSKTIETGSNGEAINTKLDPNANYQDGKF